MPRPPNFHARDIRSRRSDVNQKLVSKKHVRELKEMYGLGRTPGA